MDAVAYMRVSTEEQARSGLGLAAQRTAIDERADRQGWRVLEWIVEESSGRTTRRPGVERALGLLREDGGPKALMVARLDRLARSALDFLTLVRRAQQGGWSLVVLDVDLDMTTAVGRFTATVMAAVAELERELIRERTRAALDSARARGTVLGRRSNVSTPVASRIVSARRSGMTYQAIADALQRDGVPTAQGGQRWWASTVRYIALNTSPGADTAVDVPRSS